MELRLHAHHTTQLSADVIAPQFSALMGLLVLYLQNKHHRRARASHSANHATSIHATSKDWLIDE